MSWLERQRPTLQRMQAEQMLELVAHQEGFTDSIDLTRGGETMQLVGHLAYIIVARYLDKSQFTEFGDRNYPRMRAIARHQIQTANNTQFYLNYNRLKKDPTSEARALIQEFTPDKSDEILKSLWNQIIIANQRVEPDNVLEKLPQDRQMDIVASRYLDF